MVFGLQISEATISIFITPKPSALSSEDLRWIQFTKIALEMRASASRPSSHITMFLKWFQKRRFFEPWGTLHLSHHLNHDNPSDGSGGPVKYGIECSSPSYHSTDH